MTSAAQVRPSPAAVRIRRETTGLLVVDLQERLLPAIHNRETVVANTVCLLETARLLRLPVFLTEQYPKGLGPTVEAVLSRAGGVRPFEKVEFSAWGAAGLPEALRQGNLRDLLLCGIEAHVCVSQTALDLLHEGWRVFVLSDAVSSRTAANREAGLRRIEQAGGVVASTEMAIFELLGRAGTAEFKQALQWVK